MTEIGKEKPKILLHSCCAPCSTTAIFSLVNDYDIQIYYYNPNIEPEEEYVKRKNEEIRFVDKLKKQGYDIGFVDVDYDNEAFEKMAVGLENEREGGKRCEKCFLLRLEKVAQAAKEGGFDLFATTLTVSPHKNAELINSIGKQLEQKYNITYLETNFKKKDGYKKSIEYSKQFGLYRQDYCGCRFSNWHLN